MPVQDKSARESLQTFVGGKGDVLLAYENEAITAQQKGQELDYTIPDQTILIQNPVAVTSAADAADGEGVRGLPAHGQAQKIYQSKGYRPVNASLVAKAKFPTPSGLFKIDKLGGWPKVTNEFFDPDKGYLVDIEKSKGVPTEK